MDRASQAVRLLAQFRLLSTRAAVSLPLCPRRRRQSHPLRRCPAAGLNALARPASHRNLISAATPRSTSASTKPAAPLKTRRTGHGTTTTAVCRRVECPPAHSWHRFPAHSWHLSLRAHSHRAHSPPRRPIQHHPAAPWALSVRVQAGGPILLGPSLGLLVASQNLLVAIALPSALALHPPQA